VSSSSVRERSIEVSVLCWAAATAILLFTAWQYVPFVADDALISYRYSDRLLAGEGLTYTDGERVEGYSNLLWVLLVAAGGWLTSDLILAGRVIGSICGALALAAVVRARPVTSWRTAAPTLAGLAVLSLSHGLAIWSIGGLEQGLQSALLAWTLALVIQDRARGGWLAPSILLALLVLTRPDGALFCALIAAGLVLAEGLSAQTIGHASRLASLPLLAWCGQLGFRLWYYGEWVPNIAYIKLSPSATHAMEGVQYITSSLKAHAPVAMLGSIGLAFARPIRRRQIIVPLVVALGWTAYVVAIGGDIFPGRRHFLPILVCLAFLVMETWRARLARWPLVVQAAVLILACGGYAALQHADVENERAQIERWEWDCGVLASMLHESFSAERPLVATDGVGCMGYFGKMPTLDMLGLTDRHIARSRPPGLGNGPLGHERGDGRYVLSRQPDIVVLCSPTGNTKGCYPGSAELSALPEFAERYRLIPLASRRYFGPMLVWIRVDSPRIGVVRSAREIRIPGFLFAGLNVTVARPAEEDKRLVALVTTQQVVSLPIDDAPAGTWSVKAIASTPVDATFDGGIVRVQGGMLQSELREVVLTRSSD
jgi:arabinofuranosyltransferase